MNSVALVGRLTRDPETRQAGETMVANMTIAIDRPPKKDGTKEADFPRITAFGKTADIAQRYCRKGARIGVQGRIQTGRYENQNGETVYTTDVIADRIEIIDWPDQNEENYQQQPQMPPQQYQGGFQQYNNPFEGDPNYNYGRR